MADGKEPPAKRQKKSSRSGSGSPFGSDDIRQLLREKLKFEIPQDFLDFWYFCKELDSRNPQESLKEALGLELIGPFDFLAGQFDDVDESDITSYHLHWRYFYDPPEVVTVIKGDDKEGFHVGYYRDNPKDKPLFLCSNKANVSCEFTVVGGNLFAAINSHMSGVIKKTKDKSKGNVLRTLQSSLKSNAQELGYPLDVLTPEIKARNQKMVAKTFHKVGIVVPIDANEVGYRPLTVSDGELKRMLKNISDGKNPKAKEKASEDLQEIITLVQFANDECDYGMGLELGLNLFCFGDEKFHNTISSLAPLAYQLLGRAEFGEVIEIHLEHRARQSLSQIPAIK